MDKAILLAIAASVCTATASVCQRKGAKDNETAGFDARLMVRLARQPAWLLGIAAMIGGFIFQITALRYGDLALVQPILAAELLFVFGYLAGLLLIPEDDSDQSIASSLIGSLRSRSR